MPEERNQIATDQHTYLLLCSSDISAENLRDEGISGKVEIVGDVMVDVALRWQPAARERTADLAKDLGVEPHQYLLLTAHRAGNVDDPVRLMKLMDLLKSLPAPAVFPVHPRTRARLQAMGSWEQL